MTSTPADDIPAVLIEEGRLAEADDAAGWETCLVDTPALQLSPVELIGVAVERDDRDRLGLLSAQHAQGNACRLLRVLDR